MHVAYSGEGCRKTAAARTRFTASPLLLSNLLIVCFRSILSLDVNASLQAETEGVASADEQTVRITFAEMKVVGHFVLTHIFLVGRCR